MAGLPAVPEVTIISGPKGETETQRARRNHRRHGEFEEGEAHESSIGLKNGLQAKAWRLKAASERRDSSCCERCKRLLSYGNQSQRRGEVSERLKELASKASVGGTLPWVRIPPSPPSYVRRCEPVCRQAGFERHATSVKLECPERVHPAPNLRGFGTDESKGSSRSIGSARSNSNAGAQGSALLPL